MRLKRLGSPPARNPHPGAHPACQSVQLPCRQIISGCCLKVAQQQVLQTLCFFKTKKFLCVLRFGGRDCPSGAPDILVGGQLIIRGRGGVSKVERSFWICHESAQRIYCTEEVLVGKAVSISTSFFFQMQLGSEMLRNVNRLGQNIKMTFDGHDAGKELQSSCF